MASFFMHLKSMLRAGVYGVVEKTTSGRGVKRIIGGETIRFPVRWSRYYEAGYEPGTFAFFRAHCHAGDTVLDIGAHLGLFSVVAARRVGKTGRVFAFEPTPLTRSALRRAVSINDLDHIVEVRGEAISGSTGEATFHDTGDAVSNANSLIQSGRSQHGITVRTLTVDDFVRERGIVPQLLKIDVEGAEGGVLRGAAHTFETLRPTALLAVHPENLPADETLADLWQMLQQYRLEASLLRVGGEAPGTMPHFGQSVDEAWFCRQTGQFDVQLYPREKNTSP